MSSRTAIRRSARSRRGAALVMFAMIVFVLFAVAGLAIDIGTASLTQNNMQVAVDTAALEGIRLRDYDAYQPHSDDNRREEVVEMVRLVFDDDLKPPGNPFENPGGQLDNEDPVHLAAGSLMQVSGPMGNQVLVTGGWGGWDDPILRTNNVQGQSNKVYGDMLSGTYDPDASHEEFSQYLRPDFAAATANNGSQWGSLGFLVRMRRTTGRNPLDKERYVSERGRPIPFVFSLGSVMMKVPAAEYDPRRYGITVRATAIAVARPALRASPPPRDANGNSIPNESRLNQSLIQSGSTPNPMLGLYPFALRLDYWKTRVYINSSGQGTFTFGENHELTIQADGRLTDPDGVEAGTFAEFGTSVGQQVETQLPLAIPVSQISGYVAIYDDVPGPNGTIPRVIGYGFCDAKRSTLTPDAIEFKSGIEAQLFTQTSGVHVWVAPNGVSGRLDSLAPALSSDEWEFVMSMNKELAYGPCETNPSGEVNYDYQQLRPGTLLAPTLAR